MFKNTDERDRVFALNGLASDSHLLKPNYHIPIAWLLPAIARYQIMHEKDVTNPHHRRLGVQTFRHHCPLMGPNQGGSNNGTIQQRRHRRPHRSTTVRSRSSKINQPKHPARRRRQHFSRTRLNHRPNPRHKSPIPIQIQRILCSAHAQLCAPQPSTIRSRILRSHRPVCGAHTNKR